MRSFIFQANPDRFDIEGFLSTWPSLFSWTVTRHREQIALNDQVFLWRAIGSGQSSMAGVIAEAVVDGPVERRLDDTASIPFWLDPSSANVEGDRVTLRLIRVANSRERIRRDWLLADPVLKDLEILKFANATNFMLQTEDAHRLQALWSRTGKPWDYAESVAGLKPYAETYADTYGSEVSRLPESPVAHTALLIGRAVTGVYNKVMNFRSIDPRDLRTGMTGSGETDRQVFTQFYDPEEQVIREDELLSEFERLWGG